MHDPELRILAQQVLTDFQLFSDFHNIDNVIKKVRELVEQTIVNLKKELGD